MSRKLLDLTGEKYGRLTAVKEAPKHRDPSGKSVRMWECLCDCGNIHVAKQSALRFGEVASCGCVRKGKPNPKNATHGMSKTRQYRIWNGMLTRCYNTKEPSYQIYGARGIRVADEWLAFEGFWEDMKDGYEDHLTLDRINPNGDYCKDNCRWIPIDKQQRNRRMSSANTSGVNGVNIENIGGINIWRARWADNGECKSKSFSTKKYGDAVAFQLACRTREEAIAQLNESGAGYTEHHGKLENIIEDAN